MEKKIMKVLLSLLMSVVVLAGCNTQVKTPAEGNKQEPVINPSLPKTEKPEEKPAEKPKAEEIRIKMGAVGDNLLHNSVSYAMQVDKNKFDFTPLYAKVKKMLVGYDLAFVNQEVTLGGTEYGIGAYPNLNGPGEAANALFDAGFNVINVASNHVFDKGVSCFLSSYENIKNAGFDNITGAFIDESKTDDYCIIEEKGVKIGLLSYTYSLNGYKMPKDRPNLIPMIDRVKIQSDVEEIKKISDIVMVSMHWGNEYKTVQSGEQEELAQFLSDLGVSVIIGHHPHVLQPVQMLTGKDGNSTVCFYSLGNFVSNQQIAATMLGGLATFDIVKTVEEKFEVQNVSVTPIVTHYLNTNPKQFDIIPLSMYTKEEAMKNGVRKYDSKFTYDYIDKLATQVLGDYRMDYKVEN